MSQVTIQNAFLSVAVDRTGAELASIRDRAGHEYLWQGDARFWVSRAPILFPIVGGLKEDRYTLDGQSYTLPKHGFARTMEFAVAEKTESSVVLTLEATSPTRLQDIRDEIAAIAGVVSIITLPHLVTRFSRDI